MSPVCCMGNKEALRAQAEMERAYERAARIYSANRSRHVLNEEIREHWIPGTQDFWFGFDVPAESGVGTEYRRYCHAQRAVRSLFDHDALALALEPLAGQVNANELPITPHCVDGQGQLYFSIRGQEGEFVWPLSGGEVRALAHAPHGKGLAPSPDLARSAFAEQGELYCRDNRTGAVVRLTDDGSEQTPYARRYHQTAERLTSREIRPMPLGLKWSPDSRRLLTYRVDYRKAGRMHLVQSEPLDGTARPVHAEYPYSLPGDQDIIIARLTAVDTETGTARPVTLDGAPVELFQLAMFDAENEQVKWSADGRTAYLLRYDRCFKHAQALCVDMETARARVMAEQDFRTFGFAEYFGSAAQEVYSDSGLYLLPETGELLWLLERDEYASIWLVDARSGVFVRDLTPGDYTARRIRHVDRQGRMLYFSASGREKGVDPYLQFLYCVSLDGGEPVRLTAEPAEHVTRFCPDGSYWIDTFSTVRTAPITRVCSPDGQVLCVVAEADLSRLEARGYVVPEPFEAVARDGVTPIYGVLIRPADFDPDKKYPVVDFVYGGPQRINVPKAFDFHDPMDFDPQGGLQSLAQLGFVGVIIDGLATPLRSKSIHDMTYGKPEECCGLADHVCAIQQLAGRFPWIDAGRVGVWGSSGGGYAAVRALLQFPDFYKVGVSLCGNHDQARYYAHWGDRWIGPYSEEAYFDQANHRFADRLQGKLLLVHGDMDDNVHPSATLRLAGAFARANRDVDLLIYPNSGHGVDQYPYVVRRRWDFFVRHLLGQEPPANFDLEEASKQ